MALRIAIVSDIHGNIAALDAALLDIAPHKPDRLFIAGDLVMNGPRPSEVVQRVMALEKAGAHVVQGNTDIAVADGDYTAAFPWLDEVSDAQRQVAEWGHDQLTPEELDYLRRLPAERRSWVGDTLVLLCHASPGSQTAGLPGDLDGPTLVQRVTRSDARVIVCGHTHVADIRELGRKLIVNPGSCGYAFDEDPAAAWAMLTIESDAEPVAELHRVAYDAESVSMEVSDRGLPGDVYRAATIRNGRLMR
jgi:putative phosphoesterase